MLILASCSTPAEPTPSTAPLTEPAAPPPPERAQCDALAEAVQCPSTHTREQKFGKLYPSGAFCEIRCTDGGMLDGPFVREHIDADGFARHGQYENGKESGAWVTFARNPETLERVRFMEQHYRAGARHGPHLQWGWSGELVEQGQYVDDEKDGLWIRYSEIEPWRTFEGTFDRGTPVGEHIERFMGGQLQSKRTYDEVGRPHGTWCFWQSDGTEIECFEMTRGTGTVREYNATGELVRSIPMVDGKRHGVYVEHTPGGRSYEADYVDGLQHGAERMFDGECVARKTMWQQDEQHGPFVIRNCQAEPPFVTTEGAHCHGNPCGKWTIRGDDGKIDEVVEYSDTGEVLARIVYDEEGEMKELETDD